MGPRRSTSAKVILRYHLSYADWTGDEYVAIARSVLKAQTVRGKNASILANRLAHHYAPSTVYLSNYGHHALKVALGIFRRRRPELTEVIIPAYICPSVVNAVASCGLKAVSVDVADDLNLSPSAIQRAMSEHTLAVIAPHMYGCPARIGEIETLCAGADVFLIDDAAQVMGVQQDGRYLGCFGDVGIISFAQSKTIVTGIRGSGGALLVNKPAYDADAILEFNRLPIASARKRLGALFDFLWSYVWKAYTGDSAYYASRLLDALRRPRQACVDYAQISNLEAGIALVQQGRLDAIVKEKIRIAAAYHFALKNHPNLAFPQYAPGRYLARVMVRLPESVDLAAFRNIVADLGVETRTGYGVHMANGASAKNATNLSNRLIGVPCRAGMSDAEISDICAILSKALSLMGCKST